jgi:hypothetical protein
MDNDESEVILAILGHNLLLSLISKARTALK